MSETRGKDAGARPKAGRKDPAHVDDLLDAALADTFPASDPVSGLVASDPVGRPASDERRQRRR